MQVALKVEETEAGRPFYRYMLHVLDDDNTLINAIPVADLSQMGGGISIEKWKKSTRKRDKGKNVIGVYLWISIMGHDLDQWRYYDVDLGKDVTG